MTYAESPFIIGHRGASFDAPENTMAAFQLAWKQGADGVEGDFYLTSDEKIICIHDADTKRTTGVNLKVESTSLEKLRELDAGSWKNANFQSEKLPTFDEVLAAIPAGKRFVIELKSKAKIVPVLAKQLREANRSDIEILIISFDEESIATCKRELPQMRAHWLTSFKESPLGDGFHPTAEEVAETVQRCGADGVGMNGNREVVDAGFVRVLRQRQCNEFHVWTVDEPEDAKYFRELGAVGITTNRPDLIRTSLQ
jgi:glycerophosphoryl diester phosphodiesterase